MKEDAAEGMNDDADDIETPWIGDEDIKRRLRSDIIRCFARIGAAVPISGVRERAMGTTSAPGG